MTTTSKAVKTGFRVGTNYYNLSGWETKQHNWFIVLTKLCDEPEHNYRFYNDDELLDLLDLQRDRDNKALIELTKIYSDLGNLCPFLLETYKAMSLDGLTLDSVVVQDDKGETMEEPTKMVREWLNACNEGGFESMMDEVVEGGALYGTSYAAVRWNPEDTSTLEVIAKDAAMVFPYIDQNTNRPVKIFTNYRETATGEIIEHEWAEEYLVGQVNVYKDGKLVPEMSAETKIELLTLVGAPFKTERGSYFGKSALHGLVESLITICGTIGASTIMFRMQAGGVMCISSDDDLGSVMQDVGGGEKTQESYARGMRKLLDPDKPTVLTGKNMSVSTAQGNVMDAATPLLEQQEKFLALRCPVYGWTRLGPDASGEAIKQTYKLLVTEMNQIRRNLRTLVARIVAVMAAYHKKEIGGTVNLILPPVFPPTKAENVTEALALLDKGVVPIRYVAEVAEIDHIETVAEFLDKLDEEPEPGETPETPEQKAAREARELFGLESEE